MTNSYIMICFMKKQRYIHLFIHTYNYIPDIIYITMSLNYNGSHHVLQSTRLNSQMKIEYFNK